jgi:hypothetical protein
MEASMKQDDQNAQRPERDDEHGREHRHFEIRIDHVQYTVTLRQMTGQQLRHVPKPPIGPDRDLFEVVAGGTKRKIGDEEVVEIRNGLDFATAPTEVHFEIQIDRHHYSVTLRKMTGLQLRHVPTPPIAPTFDLFEVVPGGSDLKIGDDQVVEIRNGLRFFTAPAQINPGVKASAWERLRVTIK